MPAEATFEERVGGALDALYDGASLLAGGPERAEALVTSVVVDASRHRFPEGEAAFRRWLVDRLVRRYLEYAAAPEDDPGSATPGAGTPDPLPASGTGPLWEEGPRRALLENIEALEDAAPDRLGTLIRRSLEALPLHERAALWLVDVMDFEYEEAARAMRLNRGELVARLHRGRWELQFRLAAALQDEMRRGTTGAGAKTGGPGASGDRER